MFNRQVGGCVCSRNMGDHGRGEEGGPGLPPSSWWILQQWDEDSDVGQLRENTHRKENECFLLLDPGVVGSAYYLCV